MSTSPSTADPVQVAGKLGGGPAAAVALVTGASSGIGRLLAKRLAESGRYQRVVVVARRADRLATLAAESPPGVVVPVAGDLCDPSFRATLVGRAENEGPLALLVNNAGYGRASLLDAQGEADVAQMLALNVEALAALTRSAVAVMRPRGRGRILQISSVAGFVPMPYFALYCGTKAFVNGFVDALRFELRGSGIAVSAVCPGGVRTEFTEVAFRGGGSSVIAANEEPVERVVEGILRGLGRDRRFLFPTLRARLAYLAWRFMPWAVRAVLGSVGRRAIERALPPAAAAG